MTADAISPDDLDRHRAELALPLGEPGSGRVRYGAAMALWKAGRMSVEMLEAYRICALLDAEDPLAVHAQRAGAEAGPVAVLILAADAYLATLPGPGIAEVRAGIAGARPASPLPAAAHPVVGHHLPAALTALRPPHPALAQAIGAAAPHLRWRAYDSYPPDLIGAGFRAGHAFAPLIGEGAAFAANDYEIGLFLVAPHVLYRDHRHPAPELYAPLTGPHGWRFAPGAPLDIRQAHVPVWNDPMVPHLTKVGPVPFLCFYAWTGDVNALAEVVPADDWPELERLRLDG